MRFDSIMVGLLILTYWGWGVFSGWLVLTGKSELRSSSRPFGKFIHYHGMGFILAITLAVVLGLAIMFAQALGGSLLSTLG